MFCKVLRNPVQSFFDDEEDHHFVTGLERLVDFNPFRVPVFTIQGRPGHDKQQCKNKQLQRQTSLKRKHCCSCDCHEKTEVADSTTNSKENNSQKTTKEIVVPAPEPKKTKFEIKLNIDERYKPDELKVKLENDNRSLVVERTHEESQNGEHGFSKSSTHLYHKFSLPKDVDIEGLTCDLNEKGLMIISAPRKLPALEERQERVIPITHGHDDSAYQNGKEKQKETIVVESNFEMESPQVKKADGQNDAED